MGNLAEHIHNLERLNIEARAADVRTTLRKAERIAQRIAKLVPDWLYGQRLPYGYWCGLVKGEDGQQYRALLREDPLVINGIPQVMNMCVSGVVSRWGKHYCTKLTTAMACQLVCEVRGGFVASLEAWILSRFEEVAETMKYVDEIEDVMTGQATELDE